MNLKYLKEEVMKYSNKILHFQYCGGRGQDDFFQGRIIHFYSRTFLIQTVDGNIKNFSYSDFLIKILKIV